MHTRFISSQRVPGRLGDNPLQVRQGRGRAAYLFRRSTTVISMRVTRRLNVGVASSVLRSSSRRSRACYPRTQHRNLSSSSQGAAAASVITSLNPLTLTQEALAFTQAATGAPWWLVLAGSAVSLRVAILPAVLLQVRETRRLLALAPLFAQHRQQVAHIQVPAERARALLGKMRAECDARGVRPLRVVGLPLMQIPFLIGLIVAVRRMLLPGAPHREDLARGGAYWFPNLTAPDPTAMLPLASLLLLVTNLQIGLTRPASTGGGIGLFTILRNVFQAGSIVAFPFYAELPAGVFMYWIPNSSFSLVQTALVRRIYPPAAMAASPPSQHAMRRATASVAPAATVSGTSHLAPAPAAARGIAAPAPATNFGDGAISSRASGFASSAAGTTEVTAEELELRTRLTAHPLEIETHVQLSKLLLRAQRPAEAVDHLWPAVQSVPQEQSAPLRFQLALALGVQEQHEAAEPLLEQVLQLEPGFVECLLCLSGTQEALGKSKDAVATLEQVAELKAELREWCEREIVRIKEGAAAAEAG